MEKAVDMANRCEGIGAVEGVNEVEYRHELKYFISEAQAFELRQRLNTIMKLDSHADKNTGSYIVRSLYYDNITDSCLMDKVNGIGNRYKYRIRYYNNEITYIILERKGKRGSLTTKEQMLLTPLDTNSLISNSIESFQNIKGILLDLYEESKATGLKPKTIVEYKREPWIYNTGNVRVTIDSNIRTSSIVSEFLISGHHTIPLQNNPMILEVKYGSYLPDIIRDIVQLNSLQATFGLMQTAFSKYANSRTLV